MRKFLIGSATLLLASSLTPALALSPPWAPTVAEPPPLAGAGDVPGPDTAEGSPVPGSGRRTAHPGLAGRRLRL